MQKLLKACVLGTSLLLAACGSKVNPDNYGKIESGMTKNEVYSILGKPDEVSSTGIGSLTASNEVWRSKDHSISITFTGDQVRLKNLSTNTGKE